MTGTEVSPEHAAAYLAFSNANAARVNAEPGWRPHVFIASPDYEQVITFYSYDEALAWLRWHLVGLEEMPESDRPVRQ